MNNTFQKLIDNNICFAVCISVNTLKNISVENVSKSYFIVVHNNQIKDVRKLGMLNFHRNKDYNDIWEYNMQKTKIEEFKSISDTMFKKVLHNKFGRIYELKRESFSENYKKIHKVNTGLQKLIEEKLKRVTI
mgnify:FL=1